MLKGNVSSIREITGGIALFVMLIGVGAFAWWLQFRPSLEVDTTKLAAFPDRIGPWRSVDLPVGQAIESELRADLNVQRVYTNLSGDPIWLYIGYYGTARGGRPEHTPRYCYVAADWRIQSTRVLEPSPGSETRVNEYLVERGNEKRLIHFWYRSHRTTGMLGGFDQNVDRFLGLLLENRADGALVRVSTPVRDHDVTSARSRVLSFVTEVDARLDEHWPEELDSKDSARRGSPSALAAKRAVILTSD